MPRIPIGERLHTRLQAHVKQLPTRRNNKIIPNPSCPPGKYTSQYVPTQDPLSNTTSPSKEDFYQKLHRLRWWKPEVQYHNLLLDPEGKLFCPDCGGDHVCGHGWNVHVHPVHDIGETEWIGYTRFICKNCPKHGGKDYHFSSLDTAFLEKNFEPCVQLSLGAVLNHQTGYTHELLDLVTFLMAKGVSMATVAGAVEAVRKGKAMRAHKSYLDLLDREQRFGLRPQQQGQQKPMQRKITQFLDKSATSTVNSDPYDNWGGPFGDYEDNLLAGIKSPSAEQLTEVWQDTSQKRVALQDALVATKTADILSLDHVAYPTKFVYAGGQRCFNQLLVAVNEKGVVVGYWAGTSASLEELERELEKLQIRIEKKNGKGPWVIYVDSPETMHPFLKRIFRHVGTGLADWDDGVKMDPGHVMFSRFAKVLEDSHGDIGKIIRELSLCHFTFYEMDLFNYGKELKDKRKDLEHLTPKAAALSQPFKALHGKVRRTYVDADTMVTNLVKWRAKWQLVVDPTTGKTPFIMPEFENVFDNHMKLCKAGRLSDPKGVNLYITIPGKNNQPPTYRCMRSSSKNEAFNGEANDKVGGNGGRKSPQTANIVLSDLVTMYNSNVEARISVSSAASGCYNTELKTAINKGCSAVGHPKQFCDLPDNLQTLAEANDREWFGFNQLAVAVEDPEAVTSTIAELAFGLADVAPEEVIAPGAQCPAEVGTSVSYAVQQAGLVLSETAADVLPLAGYSGHVHAAATLDQGATGASAQMHASQPALLSMHGNSDMQQERANPQVPNADDSHLSDMDVSPAKVAAASVAQPPTAFVSVSETQASPSQPRPAKRAMLFQYDSTIAGTSLGGIATGTTAVSTAPLPTCASALPAAGSTAANTEASDPTEAHLSASMPALVTATAGANPAVSPPVLAPIAGQLPANSNPAPQTTTAFVPPVATTTAATPGAHSSYFTVVANAVASAHGMPPPVPAAAARPHTQPGQASASSLCVQYGKVRKLKKNKGGAKFTVFDLTRPVTSPDEIRLWFDLRDRHKQAGKKVWFLMSREYNLEAAKSMEAKDGREILFTTPFLLKKFEKKLVESVRVRDVLMAEAGVRELTAAAAPLQVPPTAPTSQQGGNWLQQMAASQQASKMAGMPPSQSKRGVSQHAGASQSVKGSGKGGEGGTHSCQPCTQRAGGTFVQNTGDHQRQDCPVCKKCWNNGKGPIIDKADCFIHEHPDRWIAKHGKVWSEKKKEYDKNKL